MLLGARVRRVCDHKALGAHWGSEPGFERDAIIALNANHHPIIDCFIYRFFVREFNDALRYGVALCF